MFSRRPKLLIVDDEVDTCENLSDIFTDIGYRVDLAHDGRTALRLVEQNGYDIALLDLRMPGMDGLELYRSIKRISAGTAAIVITAYAKSETASDVLEAGAWKLLPKPVDIQTLVGLVAEAIRHPLILVVDDDLELCQNLWEILRANGYRVQLARDVDEADKFLRRYEFQLVLLDIKLPGSDGADVMNVMRQTNQTARTMIITAFPAEMKSQIEQAVAAGAVAVHYKPLETARLLSAIQQWIADANATVPQSE